MNQRHFEWNGGYRQPPHAQGWAVPESYPAIKTGNVCSHIPGTPVNYNKLNIQHWPSQDYKIPHPKGFLHTMHSAQNYNQFVPHRYQSPHAFGAPPIPPQR